MKKDIHIAFEGGGGKGAAYLSIIKALEERNLIGRVKVIAGSSAGAINAFLFALGYSYDEIIDIIFKQKSFANFLPKINLTKDENISNPYYKSNQKDLDTFLQKNNSENENIPNFYYRSIIETEQDTDNYFFKWSKNDYNKYLEFHSKIKDIKFDLKTLLFSSVNPLSIIVSGIFYLKYKDIFDLLNHKPNFAMSDYQSIIESSESSISEIANKINHENISSFLFFGGLFRGDEVYKTLAQFLINKGYSKKGYSKIITSSGTSFVPSIKDKAIYDGYTKVKNSTFFSLDKNGELKIIKGQEISDYNSNESQRVEKALKSYPTADSYNAGRNSEYAYNQFKKNNIANIVSTDSLGELELENTGGSYTRINFKELYEMTGVELLITGSNITNGNSIIFSHKTTPNFPVVSAIAISMNLPAIWPPIYVNSKNKELSGWYVDGGLYNNFPIDYLRKNKTANETVIGFYLDNKENYIKPFLPLNITAIGSTIAAASLDRNTFNFTNEEDSLGLITDDGEFKLETTNFEPYLNTDKFNGEDKHTKAFEETNLHKTNYKNINEFLDKWELK